MEETLSPLALEIFSSLQLDKGSSKGEMRLPDLGMVSSLEVEAALTELLAKKFQIRLSAQQQQKIWQETSLHFSVPSAAGLPARVCSINFDSPPPTITILGSTATKGNDAYTEIAFDWRKYPGILLPDGTVDWRDINSLLSVDRGDLIAIVHDRTVGSPGITCFGDEIEGLPGRRHHLRWTRKNFQRIDDPLNPQTFKLHAHCAGVVSYSFLLKNDPQTLDNLHITDTLKVLSDIDNSSMNLQTSASLEIHGNVRGNFKLQTNGSIIAQECIEGLGAKNVTSQGTPALNRCIIRAAEEIEVGSFVNAEAAGRNILVRNNASQSLLNAREKVHFLSGANISGITIQAREVILERCTFAGKNLILLGAEFFDNTEDMLNRLTKLEADQADTRNQLSRHAEKIMRSITEIKKYCEHDMDSEMENLFLTMGGDLSNTFNGLQMLQVSTLASGNQLLNSLKAKGYGVSILRFATQFLENLTDYNTLHEKNSKIAERIASLKYTLQENTHQIKNNLVIRITEPKVFGKNTALQIKCAHSELLIFANELKGRNREIRYFSSGGMLQATHGRLEVLKHN